MNYYFHALVVEDDDVAREATVMALEQEGFICDYATDGMKAITKINRSSYDVVVTDLRMPNRHGYSLAVEVVNKGSERPLVVVLTGVLEPRLLRDLLARDIDDVEFKPSDPSLFAAKVRALCERRYRRLQKTRPQMVDCAQPLDAALAGLPSLKPVAPAKQFPSHQD